MRDEFKWNNSGTHVSEDDLILYFTGGVAPEREIEIEEHVAGCDTCTSVARGVRHTFAVLQNSTAEGYQKALADALPQTVHSALQAAVTNPQNRPLRERIESWVAMGMEAVQGFAGMAVQAGVVLLRAPTAVENMSLRSTLSFQPAARAPEIQHLVATGLTNAEIIAEEDKVTVRLPAEVSPAGGLVALIPLSKPESTVVAELVKKADTYTATFEAKGDDRYLIVFHSNKEPASHG